MCVNNIRGYGATPTSQEMDTIANEGRYILFLEH